MRAAAHSRFEKLMPQRQSSLIASTMLALCAAACARPASAHVRWFTDPNDPQLADFEAYRLTDTPALVWFAVGAFLVATAIFLDGRLPSAPVIGARLQQNAIELLRILTGMSMLLLAYGGTLLAPHLEAYGAFGTTLLFLQALIGVLLISNHFVVHAAILTILLLLGTMVQFSVLWGIEYINFIGIALFLLFTNFPEPVMRARLAPYAVDMLRIFTGLALITLGITEKLQGAVLGQAFLASYEWNFMKLLGLEWFSDQLFVLSAGAMEVIFGVIMVLGVVTRLNTAVIAGFMLTSNIVFLLINESDNALMEFVGHMPIIATASILMLLGYGQKLKCPNPTLKPASPKLQPAE